MSGWRDSPVFGIGFPAGFFGTFVVSLSALIVAFATAGKMNAKANLKIRATAAVSLVGFGAYQVMTGFQKLV